MCSRAQAEAVISILLACPQLRRLALRMVGSMDKSILSCFAHFQNLKDLTIANCGEEDKMPLSVRFSSFTHNYLLTPFSVPQKRTPGRLHRSFCPWARASLPRPRLSITRPCSGAPGGISICPLGSRRRRHPRAPPPRLGALPPLSPPYTHPPEAHHPRHPPRRRRMGHHPGRLPLGGPRPRQLLPRK